MSIGMKTPLGRVRGLGSARSGTKHFWHQRVTGFALVPLALIFVGIVACASRSSHMGAVALLSSPFVAIVLALFIGAGIIHMRLGMQVIIEDYVTDEKLKYLAVMINTFFCLCIGVACLYALLKLNFGT